MTTSKFSSISATSEISVYQIISKAGYQRMLTQRIAKCYLNLVIGANEKKYRTILEHSATEFEENLSLIYRHTYDPVILQQITEVTTLWTAYQFIYGGRLTKDNAILLLEYSNELLEACDKMVALLEADANKRKLEGVESAIKKNHGEWMRLIQELGRQRTLSQRMGLYAVANARHIGDNQYNKLQFLASLSEFTNQSQSLRASPQNTAEINQQYTLLNNSWKQVQPLLQKFVHVGSTEAIPTLEHIEEAMALTDEMLTAFDRLLFLYEGQQVQ